MEQGYGIVGLQIYRARGALKGSALMNALGVDEEIDFEGLVAREGF